MEVTSAFLTIKQAAQLFSKSEQTIRRLVKQHVETEHIRVEAATKGDTYLISQAFLAQQYPSQVNLLPVETAQVPVPEVAELQRQLVARDQLIQHLQHRLLEQNDMLNALTTQINNQRIGRIEELLLSQNEQLGELQKRLPELSAVPVVVPTSEPIKKRFWQRVFGR